MNEDQNNNRRESKLNDTFSSGTARIAGRNFIDNSKLFDQINKLTEEVAQLKEQHKEKNRFISKMRRDYTRDLQNLRNGLYLANNPISRAHAEHIKLSINVYNFDDMKDLDPELADLFNEKVNIMREEAQMQIDDITKNITSLNSTIDKYKELKPENYELMDM